jgi:hypothetical protein
LKRKAVWEKIDALAVESAEATRSTFPQVTGESLNAAIELRDFKSAGTEDF